jgi:hypothetical protein
MSAPALPDWPLRPGVTHRLLIRTDGSITPLDRTPKDMDERDGMIGASTTDLVALRHLGAPLHVMIVDDDGYETEFVDHGTLVFERRCVRALKPVNARATELYHANCLPGTTHQIVGDVLVLPDGDFA